MESAMTYGPPADVVKCETRMNDLFMYYLVFEPVLRAAIFGTPLTNHGTHY